MTALYEGNAAAAAAGLHTWRVPARRAVNSNAEKRGIVEEIVVFERPRRSRLIGVSRSPYATFDRLVRAESGGTGRRAGLRSR